MTSRSSSKLLSDHTSFVVTKSKWILFNKYLTTFWVISCKKVDEQESLAKGVYFISQNLMVLWGGLNFKLPEDVLMAGQELNLLVFNFLFSKHLYGANIFCVCSRITFRSYNTSALSSQILQTT